MGKQDPIEGQEPALDVSVLRAVISLQHELAEVGLDLKAVMQRIAERTRELTAGTAAAVRLLDGDALVCGAVSGRPELAQPHRLPFHNNFSGHALRSRRSLLCLDTETDPRVDSALSRSRGVRSIIAVPLLHGGRAVGLLLLYADEPGAFSERDVMTMELLSVVLSAAMAHAAEYEAKREQVAALARFEATFASAQVGMLLLDLDGHIIDSNPAIQGLLGESGEELAGRVAIELVHSYDRRRVRSAFRRMLGKESGSKRLQHRMVGRDGRVLWVDAAISVVHPSDSLDSYALLMLQDITQRKEAEAALLSQAALNEHQALHDALTGLPNRTLFRDRVAHAVRALERSGSAGAVLTIDLDGFILIAQQTGLIKPLTLYVIDAALRQCRAWLQEGLRLAIAVNLSTRNLVDAQFAAQVAVLLDKWGIESELLELEITESSMLADPARTRLVLDQLSAMGLRLSIDDFGTGYSSLAYLKRLPVSEIKVDRSFVMNMDEDADDAVIVRSTIDLGRNLGLDVVAEGVETEQVWERLRDLGCTAAQGYYLSRPLPGAELVRWLRASDGGLRADQRAA